MPIITLQERKQLGKEGGLWGMEILVNIETEVKRHHLENLTNKEMMKIRNDMWAVGIMLPIGPHTWVVVPPGDIKTVYITRQTKFFEP